MSKADEIIEVLNSVLKEVGCTLRDIHLLGYNKWKELKEDMERELWSRNLDLSFTSQYSEVYGVKLSGNAGGIINDYRYFYYINPDYGWDNISLSDAKDILAKHKSIRFFETDRYGFPVQISKEKFLVLIATEKNSNEHIGIGSQSSIISTTIKMYRDSQNNLLFNKNTLIYD